MNARLAQALRARPARTGVSSVADTVWVGYRGGQTNNYWKVGVGPWRPGVSSDGLWDFEHPVHGDSLQGWWPIRRPHVNSSGAIVPDVSRPWWAAENGNQANYVIDEGRFDTSKLGTAWPGNRTFGVVGVWHSDPGSGAAGTGVHWAPLAGARSAWMGVRRHGDLTASDPVTGNPFNADALQFNGSATFVSTSVRLFPGYGNQMDQMLYRDVDLTGAPPDSGVRITFRYRTQMSTLKNTTLSTRTGWYEGDPLSLNSVTPGNFISAEAGSPANALAPIDSFQVYVGAPVEGTFLASDGVVRPIYDPLRRWFNEVLNKNARFWKFSRAGADSGQVTVVVSKAEKDAIVAAAGSPTLRLVFRVHTNQSGSDESGLATYTSNGRGAAQVDDVQANSGTGFGVIGDFEGTDPSTDIDNTKPAGAAWRSTGKPPGIKFHAHDLASLSWNDICGPLNSPNRLCNLGGAVISMGDHDDGEATAGPDGTPDHNGNWGIVSPTICLKTAGPSTPNAWDLTGDMATATQDYYFAYEIYTGVMDFFNTGVWWHFEAQVYPVLQADGTPTWSELRRPGIDFFDSTPQCFLDLEPMGGLGLLGSANSPAHPDSLRMAFIMSVQCYRFGITTGCGPAAGAYLDNMSLAIVDGPSSNQAIGTVAEWFHDTFPTNETPGLPGTLAFDTTAAQVKSGIDIAQGSGTLQRFDVPGDTITVTAAGTDTRVDLVFRIKPGVGDYVVPGNPASGLRRVPTATGSVSPGDGSWWGTWEALPGDFATPGATALHAGWPGGWDPHVWMSARCDTAQIELFPIAARNIGPHGPSAVDGSAPDPSRWMSTYHESDPHLALLGIPRHKCFFIDTLGIPIASNITCSTVPAWVTVNPARSGYDGNPATTEGTKILPDGLFTPGTHVEYFFRSSLASSPGTVVSLCPDTTTVVPQTAEGSLDGHRWQEFGVLPDRWKDPAFGGDGMACMLVIDQADGRGDELEWVAIADSSGYTRPSRYGAHNGWHAAGGADPNDPAGFVAAHGGQAGSTWDLYSVHGGANPGGAAGTIGSRLSYRDPSVLNLVDGRYARMGPTPEMLATYYREVLLLTADVPVQLGPTTQFSADDVGILTGFLLGSTQGAPRGLAAFGDGFAEGLTGNPFLANQLGMELLAPSYLALTGNGAAVPDLLTSTDLAPDAPVLGVRNPCWTTLDVLAVNANLPEARVLDQYAPVGGNSYVAAVYKPAIAARPWIAATHGFSIQRLTSRWGANTAGRRAYAFDLGANVFGALCVPVCIAGGCASVGESPGSGGIVLSDYLRLLDNPLARGDVTLQFGLAAPDRVQAVIYDVSGRRVRTLADRAFPAGEHRLAWDGTDDGGRRLARGVYFSRVSFASRGFEGEKKIVLLR